METSDARPLALTSSSSTQLITLVFTGKMRDEAVRKISAEVDRLSEPPLPVLFDLSNVTHMDSMGVALIVKVAKRKIDQGVLVAVLPGSGPVARLLGIARLDKVLNVCFSREEALLALGVAAS